MNPVVELAQVRQNALSKMIDIEACLAILGDTISKLENYDNHLEVQEIISCLQSFVDKLDP